MTARIGNPPQAVFLLADTSTSLTTVAESQWCSNTTISGYSCDDRGRAFDKTKSTTWRSVGLYTLQIRPELAKDRDIFGVTDLGYGDYGRDAIKFKEGDREIQFDDQLVATVNDSTLLLGSLGLGIEVRSFSNEEAFEGLLTTLYDTAVIPSRSYGYTAGNYHRELVLSGCWEMTSPVVGTTKTPVDLVLGGHNTGQYQPSDLSFKLDTNNNPVATLETVSVSATGNPPWGAGSQDLLITPANVRIDSSTPYLWLPEEACRRFEQNLGLTWNSTSNLYLLDNITHDKLKSLNLSFKFAIAAAPGDEKIVEITVPYASFDLEIGWPFVNQSGTQRYFPLKRASTDEQLTLGRAFLQDAYLIVDHERGNFSVHQALSKPAKNNIVPIYHPSDSTAAPPSSPKKKSLSSGAITGIAIGVGVLVCLILIAIFIFVRRRRAAAHRVKMEQDNATTDIPPGVCEAYGETYGETSTMDHYKPRPFSEDATTLMSPTTTEMPADEPPVERFELTAVNLNPAELDGQEGGSHMHLRGGDTPHSPGSTLIGSRPISPAETGSRPISELLTPATGNRTLSTPPWSPMSPLTPESEAAGRRILWDSNNEKAW